MSGRTTNIMLLIVFLLSVFSCSGGDNDKNTTRLIELGDELGYDLYRFESVAIINVDACPSCSGDLRRFFVKNEKNPSLLIILSSQSVKKCEFLSRDFEHLNILYDVDQKAFKHLKLLDMEPVVYIREEKNFKRNDYRLSDFSELWIEHYSY